MELFSRPEPQPKQEDRSIEERVIEPEPYIPLKDRPLFNEDDKPLAPTEKPYTGRPLWKD